MIEDDQEGEVEDGVEHVAGHDGPLSFHGVEGQIMPTEQWRQGKADLRELPSPTQKREERIPFHNPGEEEGGAPLTPTR